MLWFCSRHAVGVALLLASTLPAATYEVAPQHPTARDDAPGTAAQPWKTLAKAAKRAGPGDVVLIHSGVYRERLLVEGSGTAQSPIRFEAAPGERVVLTGADRLIGWRKVDDAGPVYSVAWHGLHAHDNVIIGNGFAETRGAWGAQAAICLSSSPDCVIERNLMIGNREGFNFREQLRTTPTISNRTEQAVWNQNEVIRRNLIAFNRDAQIWGWFDVKDDRHWPAKKGLANLPTGAANKPGDLAAAYAARTSEGQPVGLTLEKLRLRFERNVYFAAPGQGGFKWGPAWARHQSYTNLSEFRSDLGIDVDSQMLDPDFADVLQLDFRLQKKMMALLKETYPRGAVPGVKLGVR